MVREDKKRKKQEQKEKRDQQKTCGVGEVYKVMCVFLGDATSASEYRASVLSSTVIFDIASY